MALQSLPPEILGEIMVALHDPDDLRSFIAASPNGLRIFNLFRNRILVSVSLNAIEPEARHAALAIGHVPYMKTNKDGRLQRQFLDDFFGNKNDAIFRLPDTSETIASFCGLVCRIMYFVDDFAAQAWTRLHADAASSSSTSPPSPPPPLVLLRTERAAFQRAFFLFELFAKVFPVYRWRSRFAEEIIGDQAQADLFLSRVGPCDLKAMSCVYIYYTRLLQQHTKYAEDDFVNWVMAMPSVYQLSIPDRPSRLESSQARRGDKEALCGLPDDAKTKLRDDSWEFFYKMDYDRHGIRLFSSGFRDDHAYQVAHLMLLPSRRSLFAYRVAHASGEARAMLIIRGSLNYGRDGFFKYALPLAMARSEQQRRQLAAYVPDSDSADSSTTSAVYALTRQVDPGVYSQLAVDVDVEMNYALVDRAYVFWDAERIRQPAVAASLADAGNLSREEAEHCYKSSFGPSVQKRLDAVAVHERDFLPFVDRLSGDGLYEDFYEGCYWPD